LDEFGVEPAAQALAELFDDRVFGEQELGPRERPEREPAAVAAA
jgi:hypothetical protein